MFIGTPTLQSSLTSRVYWDTNPPNLPISFQQGPVTVEFTAFILFFQPNFQIRLAWLNLYKKIRYKLVVCILRRLKGTIHVISNNPLFKEGHTSFTTIFFKHVSVSIMWKISLFSVLKRDKFSQYPPLFL